MTINPPPRVVMHRGLTLVELTVVIAVLLCLISLMSVASNVWKRGSNRAGCILAIRNVQMATRSYQNLYGYNYGERPHAMNGSQDIAAQLLANGYIQPDVYDRIHGAGECPGGGTYSSADLDLFPAKGDLYITCSLIKSEDHGPVTYTDW